MFKNYDQNRLFQTLCLDIVERFELLCNLSVVLLSYPKNPGTTFGTYILRCLFAFLIEIAVDWIKHGFLCKNNSFTKENYLEFNCIYIYIFK